MPTDIEKLYNIYVANIARFPALYEALAEQLGVSVESIYSTGVGLIPCDEYGSWSWVTPERNAEGKVIGLNRRFANGKKLMVPGSKRGLVYVVSHDTSMYEKPHGWARVSKTYPCPLCGKPDGCLYPKGEHHNPNSVICVHIKAGSAKPMELGYLHILDPVRQKLVTRSWSILAPSEHPTLVVEGHSDVCAAYDLGFVVVGKPSAASKSQDLIGLLTSRRVVVIGENDAGAGRAGMESTFAQLKNQCPDCTKLMPPEGVKDLRQWVNKGLTKEELLRYIENQGDQTLDSDVFESDEALVVARTWLRDTRTDEGKQTLGIYREDFVEFTGGVYEKLTKNQIKSRIYQGIGGRKFLDATNAVKPYKLTSAKVRDIMEACTAECLIEPDPPCWLTPGDHPDPSRLIVFQNGILNVDEYMAGHIKLYPPTPDLFTFNVFPYKFDENAESELWEQVYASIVEDDEERMLLLQQWFGYNTVADMSQEKLLMLKGLTGAGKGTVTTALQAMMGDCNAGESSFLSLSGDFGLHPLMNKLSVVMGDVVSASKREERSVLAKILTIVGRDAVVVNLKGKAHLPKVHLNCRFTFAMNDYPALTDNSGSLERRTMILPFNKSFVGHADTTLKDRLTQEASEGKLINWALRGLKSLYENGKFIEPQESRMAMRAFKQLTSPIPYFAQYCLEETTEGPGVSADHLYELWRWWCKREGIPSDDKSTLLRNIQSCLPHTVQILDGEVGNPDRMIMGIQVTEWAKTSFGQC